MKREDEFATA